jgi:hypothetical protein
VRPAVTVSTAAQCPVINRIFGISPCVVDRVFPPTIGKSFDAQFYCHYARSSSKNVFRMETLVTVVRLHFFRWCTSDVLAIWLTSIGSAMWILRRMSRRSVSALHFIRYCIGYCCGCFFPCCHPHVSPRCGSGWHQITVQRALLCIGLLRGCRFSTFLSSVTCLHGEDICYLGGCAWRHEPYGASGHSSHRPWLRCVLTTRKSS